MAFLILTNAQNIYESRQSQKPAFFAFFFMNQTQTFFSVVNNSLPELERVVRALDLTR